MAPAKPAKQDEKVQAEQSLTTILNDDQRAQLLKLLTQSMLCMRKTITDTFDPRYTGLSTDERFDNPETHNDELSEEELQKQRDEAELRIQELSQSAMQNLKKAALNFFDEWREAVTKRVEQSLERKTDATKSSEEHAKDLRLRESVGIEAPDNSNTINLAEKDLNVEDLKTAEGSEKTASKLVHDIYQAIDTPLANLDKEKRKTLLHSLVLVLLSLESYTAHSRVLLLYVTSSLHLSVDDLANDEANTAKALLQAAKVLNADKEREEKEKDEASSRKWKVGLAAVAGAAVIGVTGGLAAPLLGAGVATVMGGIGLAETAVAGYLGALAGSTVLIGSLFGAYGAHMSGKMMDEYAKQVEDFAFLPIHAYKHKILTEADNKLRVAIAISGWLSEKEEVIEPWRMLSTSTEGYALRYEMEALLKLGNALTALLKSTAWSYAKKEIIRRTIFAALKEALWPLSILNVAEIIDNPFSVAKARSDKAGEVLADALMNKVQGERPVTLIGYSLGARVIYACLLRLAEKKAFGLVENVVLLGLPATSDSAHWRMMRAVISGRLINVYSENDYVLAFLYRTSSIRLGVAGLQKADFVRGVESVDATDIVPGHLSYRYRTGIILKRVGIEDIDLKEVEREEEEAELVQTALMDEIKSKENREPTDEDTAKLEAEIARKNKQSMLDWAKSRWQTGTEHAAAYWQDVVAERKPDEKAAQPH